VLKGDEHNTIEFDFVSVLCSAFRGITDPFQPVTTWRGKHKGALVRIDYPPSSLSSARAKVAEG